MRDATLAGEHQHRREQCRELKTMHYITVNSVETVAERIDVNNQE